MKKKLLIFGAGGHGRVVADAASGKYEEIAFLNDNEPAIPVQYPIIGTLSDYRKFLYDYDCFPAFGNSALRRRVCEQVAAENGTLAVVIHPNAVLGSRTKIGAGTFLAPGVIVNNNAKIGRGVILNTSCSVDHDCEIGDYVHVSVGAHLCGTVKIGPDSWIGAGATVINNLTVCGGCMIGAGAVVVKNIEKPGTYVGVPAEFMKR